MHLVNRTKVQLRRDNGGHIPTRLQAGGFAPQAGLPAAQIHQQFLNQSFLSALNADPIKSSNPKTVLKGPLLKFTDSFSLQTLAGPEPEKEARPPLSATLQLRSRGRKIKGVTPYTQLPPAELNVLVPMVVHTCNCSTGKAETVGPLRLLATQPCLLSELQANKGPCFLAHSLGAQLIMAGSHSSKN